MVHRAAEAGPACRLGLTVLGVAWMICLGKNPLALDPSFLDRADGVGCVLKMLMEICLPCKVAVAAAVAGPVLHEAEMALPYQRTTELTETPGPGDPMEVLSYGRVGEDSQAAVPCTGLNHLPSTAAAAVAVVAWAVAEDAEEGKAGLVVTSEIPCACAEHAAVGWQTDVDGEEKWEVEYGVDDADAGAFVAGGVVFQRMERNID